MTKKEIRQKYIQIRNDVREKINKSIVIEDNVLKTNEYNESNVIALYRNKGSEVRTELLIRKSLLNNKIVVLPRVEENELMFYKIDSLSDKFELSKYGILEPLKKEENYVDKKDIDLIIVPGICFDINNNRVGYGKGYYDRFLMNSDIFTIGLCFSDQILLNDIIDYDKYDVKMKLVISEKGVNNAIK